jgi:trehalose/maltose hydrolase-like predicted phosphorylase
MPELVDQWKLGLAEWQSDAVQRYESILSIGNGRIGQRANFEVRVKQTYKVKTN